MNRVLRSVAAVLGGIVLSGLVVLVVESIGHTIYPPPPDIDLEDPIAMATFMAQLPVGALVFVLLAWVAGPVAGGYLAARIAPYGPVLHALVVGALATAADATNILSFPHPTWLAVLGLLLPVPAAYLGARLTGRSSRLSLEA